MRNLLLFVLLSSAVVGFVLAAPWSATPGSQSDAPPPPPSLEEPPSTPDLPTEQVLPGDRSLDSLDVPPRNPEEEMPPLAEEDCGLEGRDREDPEGHLADEPEPGTGKVTFAVQFRDEVNTHRLISTSVLPGEEIELEVVLTGRRDSFRASATGGTLEGEGPETWAWTAPSAPGIYCIHIRDSSTGEEMCLQVFVLRPWDGSPELEGYRIGRYPTKPLRGLPAYDRPRGFMVVDPEDYDRWVSPHFQLRQFLCKQDDGPPKLLRLSSRLLLKLELLLEEVNDRGIEAESFFVMSGYRTPWYNAAIGNSTTYSRHSYGDAADIFVDEDRDGRMDDLNGDGKITRADAAKLAAIVEDLHDSTWYAPFVGGLGLYGPAPHRGPFIHVDTRGFRARW